MEHTRDSWVSEITTACRNAWSSSSVQVCLIAVMMVVWGCSSAPSGDSTARNSGTYSGKGLIGSASGGAISVETSDGILVTLDIPGGTLDTSREITLTVTPDQDAESSNSKAVQAAADLTITISPAVSLLDSARLTITFPENRDGSRMVVCLAGDGLIPLKQSLNSGVLTGTIYSLGEFSCTRPDVGDLIASAYSLINRRGDGVWQDAFEAFDALVWLSDYLARQGYPAESSECFSAIVETSRESVQAFLASVAQIEKGSVDFRSVDMFRRLMVLCENPENIISDLNALIPSNE